MISKFCVEGNLMLYIPVNHFSVMAGKFPVFLGQTSIKQRIKSYSRTQHSGSGESQTSKPLIPSLTHYQLCHCSPVFVCFISFLRLSQQFFIYVRDRSSWVDQVLGKDKCGLLKDNTVMPVRLQPAAPWSRVKFSTTELTVQQ